MKTNIRLNWRMVPSWIPVLILIIAISLLIKGFPYLFHDYYFEVGFDTGIYERLSSFYLDSTLWDILPAYPSLPPGYTPYINQVEPGLFVVLGMADQFIGGDVNSYYRYYLPVLMGTLSVLFGFIAGRHIGGSNLAGILAATLISMSYIQIEALNESFHRQVLAALLLIISVVYFDRFLAQRKAKFMLLSALLASGTMAFHISVILLFGFLLIYALIFFVRRHQWGCIKILFISSFLALLFSSPFWSPRIDSAMNLIEIAISESIWRSSTLPTGEGLWTAGGAIPALLRGFPHILIGYILLFLPTVVLTFASYFLLWKEKKLYLAIPILSIFLWIYIGLWLFFGNRYLLNLDMLLCILAPVAIIYFIRNFGNGRWKKVGIIAFLILIMIPNCYFVIDSQLEKSPYIVENMEGVDWILENIDSECSVIFAPDYLSANIIQLGYDMAIWDYSISEDMKHPSYAAEEFMLEAPSNLTFLVEFFGNNPEYLDKDLYVLWGEWDLDRPLVKTKKLIPVDEYPASPNFELGYDGYSEILKIYEFVGPRS
ncbi:MAG: ArnT family glycosyltransferase [Candidatus Thorarchaeota archaeon]